MFNTFGGKFNLTEIGVEYLIGISIAIFHAEEHSSIIAGIPIQRIKWYILLWP